MTTVIDFHTHLLPAIDDGSRNLTDSIAMIRKCLDDGVKTVVATPHFDPETESPDSFLERRAEALERIAPHVGELRLVPAAEVKFCRGFARMDGIEKTGLEGYPYMLVEMPFSQWDKAIIKDVIDLVDHRGILPIMAHVDRYWIKENQPFFDELLEAGALLQVNVSSLKEFWKGRRLIRQIRDNRIHLLASDCHNMSTRPPELKDGFEILKKHGLADQVEENEKQVFSEQKVNLIANYEI